MEQFVKGPYEINTSSMEEFWRRWMAQAQKGSPSAGTEVIQ